MSVETDHPYVTEDVPSAVDSIEGQAVLFDMLPAGSRIDEPAQTAEVIPTEHNAVTPPVTTVETSVEAAAPAEIKAGVSAEDQPVTGRTETASVGVTPAVTPDKAAVPGANGAEAPVETQPPKQTVRFSELTLPPRQLEPQKESNRKRLIAAGTAILAVVGGAAFFATARSNADAPATAKPVVTSTSTPKATPSATPTTAETTATTTRNPNALSPDAINALWNSPTLFDQQKPDVKRALAFRILKQLNDVGYLSNACDWPVTNGLGALCDSNPIAQPPNIADDGRALIFQSILAEQMADAMSDPSSDTAGGPLDVVHAKMMLANVVLIMGAGDKSGQWQTMTKAFNVPGAQAGSIKNDISYAPNAKLSPYRTTKESTGIQIDDWSTKAVNQVIDGKEYPVKQVVWHSTHVAPTLSTFALTTFPDVDGNMVSEWLKVDDKPAPNSLGSKLPATP